MAADRAGAALAALVLRATSIEYGEGTVPVTGLLLDMPRVFEDFSPPRCARRWSRCTAAGVASQLPRPLRRGGLGHDPAGHRLVPRPGTGHRGRRQVQDRAARWLPQRRPLPAARLLHRARGRRGHLVYAAGGEPTTHTARNAGVAITYHALDLAAPPAGLLAQLAGGVGRTPVTGGRVALSTRQVMSLH